jgi:DNA processing protein
VPRSPDEVGDATLRLLLARGVGPTLLEKIRATLGDDGRVVASSVAEMCSVPGVGRSTAEKLVASLRRSDPDREREAMRVAGARLILRGDDDYPALLAVIPDPPPALWVHGRIVPEDEIAVAVVGSRRCTTYGRTQASRFAGLLAQCGLTVVSGGALGVDSEAHRGALRGGGRTLAVMGCGLAHTYPPQHAGLFSEIVESESALISEFPMQTPPRPHQFPRRNRIISGLSIGVLLIEAARRSGALITAQQASEDQGREVMALPGRVDSPTSRGALEAIRDGWAAAVIDLPDVLRQLESAGHLVRGALAAGRTRESNVVLDGANTAAQCAVLDALAAQRETCDLEQLAAATSLPMSRLLAEVTMLEIRGRVVRDHRGVRLARTERDAASASTASEHQ